MARVAPKRLFVYGVPEIITSWWVTYHDVEQNPKSFDYFATNQQILARNLLISGIERDGEDTDGDTDARTNIDFFEASYTKSPFGAINQKVPLHHLRSDRTHCDTTVSRNAISLFHFDQNDSF